MSTSTGVAPTKAALKVGDTVLLSDRPCHRDFVWMDGFVGRVFEVVERRRRSHGRSAALKLKGCATGFYVIEKHVEKYVKPEESIENGDTEEG